MRPRRSALTLIPLMLTCLLGLSPGQEDEDKPKKSPSRDTWPWSEFGDEEARETLRGLQGAWKLTTLIDPNVPDEGRLQVGYALIVDQYMSLEIHLGWDHGRLKRPLGMIRSGTHRIAVGPDTRIELTSMIGTFLDQYGDVRAERPGEIRVFDLTLSTNLFTLDRLDGYEVTFQRFEDSRPRRDIFGRERKEGR